MLNCPRCSREIPDDAVLCCYCGRVIVRKAPSKIHQRPNGTGCAFQRKGQKTWTAQYTVPTGWYLDENGKRHRKYKTKGGFKTKADALNYIETLRKENDRKPCPPLSEYWKQYSEGDLLKLGPDKIMAYKIAWRRMEKLSARRVDTISLNEMQDCVDSETSSPAPPPKSTWTRICRSLSPCRSWKKASRRPSPKTNRRRSGSATNPAIVTPLSRS